MLQGLDSRLVGRSAELARLAAALDDAAAGRPAVTLVSGDAGVGKTRLVTELAVLAAERGFLVLAGRCAELADSVPYLPLADALRTAATRPDADSRLLDALAARPVLSRLLPDTGTEGEVTGSAPGMAQQRLFGAVLGMLAELAEATPVLLILEDLHWADQSTRDLVTFLSRVLNRERLAAVVSYRTDDLHRRHPLRPMLAELTRLPGVRSVDLGPLDSEAMAEHLAALASGPLDAAVLGQIIARAEGNAYYAEELLAASAAGHELPARLADLLLARAEGLSGAAQQVLRAASVAGRHVQDDLVQRICGLAGPEYEAAIREAVASRLLVPEGEHGYAFRHALQREAIYGDLLPSERTRLHDSLADLLATDPELSGMAGTAAELAHHCLASHDIPGAFAASVLAGHEAQKLAAPAEAHRHYDLALSLWDRVGDPEALAGADRGTLAYYSATSAADSGEVSRAVHELRALIGQLADGPDRVLFSKANERLAYLLTDVDGFDEAMLAAQAAVDALPEHPASRVRARALAMHARTLLFLTDSGLARARAEEAKAAASAAAAPGVEADALVTLGMISERTGDPGGASALFAAARDQARAAADLAAELRAAFQLARISLEQGDLVLAACAADEGTRRAAAAGLGLAPYGLDLRYLHYLAHYADGEWDHAQEIADSFTVRVTSVAEARLSAMALFIDVARGSPLVDERRAWLEPFRADQFTDLIATGLLAEHALWLGDAAAALADAQAIIRREYELNKQHEPPVIRVAAVGLGALADRARQARAFGEARLAEESAATAAELLEVARAAAGYRSESGFVLGVDGQGWLARAEAEYGRAVGSNDPDAWRATVDAFDRGFYYETARSRWRLAESLAEAGDREAAREQWLLAVTVSDELRAVPLRSALADLGRRARLAGPAGTQAGAAADGPGRAAAHRGPLAGLTDRERDVLRLLTIGRTNKEIGTELFIAPKTASVHVSNILAKLGAASRTEAAAIAHREGAG